MPLTLRTFWVLVLLLSSGSDPLGTLLPPNGTPSGWQRQGQERRFSGSALYQHINGGAELYRQFGFDRLLVQDYARDAHEVRAEIYKMNDPDAHEVRAEIYKMNDPAGAGAVFAELTRGLTVQELYGTHCVLDDYQLLFQRGAFCVSVTTYESNPETRTAMAAIAAKIDMALAGLPPL